MTGPWPDIERSIRETTGTAFAIESRAGAGGGCINECHVVRGGERAYFVKLNTPDRADMFAAEADGLTEIDRTRTVRVPSPICHGASGNASWIVLEFLELRSADAGAMAKLGEALARLHRATGSRFGWHRDNTIGATPQLNDWATDWVDFYARRRLGRQLDLAERAGHGGRWLARGRDLCGRLGAFFTDYTPRPSLLHGDLWGGNWATDASGAPVIFDPATYYGDREADLAMTRLFGGFGREFYAAYEAAWPLDRGAHARRDLYNLYHVLNHLELFGGGYRAQAERMIDRLLAEIR